MPTAAHFLYIPGVLLLGIVIGWILGSRAAADAYASQMKRQQRSRRPRLATPERELLNGPAGSMTPTAAVT